MPRIVHHPDRACFTCAIDANSSASNESSLNETTPNEATRNENNRVTAEAVEAVLEYQLLPGEGINFSRTYVPDAARGKGVAEALVRHGLQWANEQGYTIQASCWYVDKFLR